GASARQPERASRQLDRQPHCQQYMRRLDRSGRAGRTRGSLNPGHVQCQQKRLAFESLYTEMDVIAESAVSVALQPRSLHGRFNPMDEPVPQAGESTVLRVAFLARQSGSTTESYDTWDVQGSGPASFLRLASFQDS